MILLLKWIDINKVVIYNGGTKGQKRGHSMKQKPEALCTVILIAINTVVFFVMTVLGDTENVAFMLMHGAMYEPMITQQHEYYRIITSMFLHFGIDHFLNNMVMLGALGWNLEQETGKIKFVIIYMFSGIGGNILSLAWNVRIGESAVSVGASGAIFGIMGALLYVVIVNRGRLGRLSGRGMLIMVGLSLYFGLTSTGVDNWAHIGGLLTGFILAAVLYRRKKAVDPTPEV